MKKLTLHTDGTLAHIWLESLHTNIPEDVINVSDAIATTLLNNRQTKAYINGDIVDIVPAFGFDSAFSAKNTEIRSAFHVAMQPITGTYTAEDIASFATQ